MGRPETTTEPWVVIDAQPRHVFYQALTLLRKANRLAEELGAAERVAPPMLLEEEIAPADVLGVVDLSRAQIDAVRGELGMPRHAVVDLSGLLAFNAVFVPKNMGWE